MKKTPRTLALFLMLIPACLSPAEDKEPRKEKYDFNFDGHMDYRVMTEENGKADLFDVFLFDPESGDFRKDDILSGTIHPQPDPETKLVNCIWSGGHSGAIYSSEVYKLADKSFKLSHVERQTSLQVGDDLIYVRVKSKLENGVPVIESIEKAKPHWQD